MRHKRLLTWHGLSRGQVKPSLGLTNRHPSGDCDPKRVKRMGSLDNPIRSDLNNPIFQEHLLGPQKPERNAAVDTLRKIRLLSWGQLYRDNGLKWEKIVSVKPLQGVDAIYSLRITQSRHCTAYREGDFMRLLPVAPDHNSTNG